jgi:predicted esterase
MNEPPIPRKIGDFECLQFGPDGHARPVVVWLHGIGERGADLSMVTRYGLPAALVENRVTKNATVVCPQLESDAEWQPARVQGLLSELKPRFLSVSLVGFSLGGQGVCDVLCEYGAVADLHVAIAGRARELPRVDQRSVRFLAISGELDPWPQVQAFVESVCTRNGHAQEVILAGQGHFISESAFQHPRFQELTAAIGLQLSIQGQGGQ